MNSIPICFAFDNNLVTPAAICLSSLLRNAAKTTFYEIKILFINLSKNNQNYLKGIFDHYSNYSLDFIDCRQYFSKGYETRRITSTAYLRLWIPQLLGNYDKIIYCDVDIIFKNDLTPLYKWNIENHCFAGVKSPKDRQKYSNKQGWGRNYINSGVLLINNQAIEKPAIEKACKLAATANYKFQDQDIINQVFSSKILSNLPAEFNYTPSKLRKHLLKHSKISKGNIQSSSELPAISIIHYAGAKPWEKPVLLGEYWWREYIDSQCFNLQFYLDYCLSSQRVPSLKVSSRKFLKSLLKITY
ncbi:MAG: glycosyltransferase family 8 protein [Cellvibrionaceae bacterium]|nr:glycosyltransferase family 8 protein [Cellvibrionaceae bacterium]